ncbi:hypothetical protein COLU111180_09190 [Cohnella lubricantis]
MKSAGWGDIRRGERVTGTDQGAGGLIVRMQQPEAVPALALPAVRDAGARLACARDAGTRLACGARRRRSPCLQCETPALALPAARDAGARLACGARRRRSPCLRRETPALALPARETPMLALPAAQDAGHSPCLRSVNTDSSGTLPKRKGSRVMPMPRFTYSSRWLRPDRGG